MPDASPIEADADATSRCDAVTVRVSVAPRKEKVPFVSTVELLIAPWNAAILGANGAPAEPVAPVGPVGPVEPIGPVAPGVPAVVAV